MCCAVLCVSKQVSESVSVGVSSGTSKHWIYWIQRSYTQDSQSAICIIDRIERTTSFTKNLINFDVNAALCIFLYAHCSRTHTSIYKINFQIHSYDSKICHSKNDSLEKWNMVCIKCNSTIFREWNFKNDL